MCVFNVHHLSAQDSLICFNIRATLALNTLVACSEFQSRFHQYINFFAEETEREEGGGREGEREGE